MAYLHLQIPMEIPIPIPILFLYLAVGRESQTDSVQYEKFYIVHAM